MTCAPQVFIRAICAIALSGWVVDAAPASVFNMPPGQTSLEFVPVGDAGNPADPNTGFGSVAYSYNIGKFEVTIGQYTQFLNAVAATDTYALFDEFYMDTDPNVGGIARGGSPGSYTYSPIGSPNRPVAYVNWGDAARFANWLTNGQPTGTQGPETTEIGSYSLNGAMGSIALNAVTRNPNGRYFIPTESEWYKAAYHKNDGLTDHYFVYPTASDNLPTAGSPPGGSNSANFNNVVGQVTDVGAYTGSPSPYGTFDQGGNLSEWTEEMGPQYTRYFRGGSWNFSGEYLSAQTHGLHSSASHADRIGFRIAEVPEPQTGLILLVWLAFLRRSRVNSFRTRI